MKSPLTVFQYVLAVPLSLIGALALFSFYKDSAVYDTDKLYAALRQQEAVEAFGLSNSPDRGGNAELWLTNGGFVKFSYSTSRDIAQVSEQGLIYQIGKYSLECDYANGGHGFLRIDRLGDALKLSGDFPLSRIFDEYDSILEAASRLPDDVTQGPNAADMNCWKNEAPVNKFYMYPPINIKQLGKFVYWREAPPICPTFLRIQLCNNNHQNAVATSHSINED